MTQATGRPAVSLAKTRPPEAQGEPAEPRALTLGGELARGGEGVVYAVAGDPGLLAKIWHEPDPMRAAKVSLMTAHPAAERVGEVAAWPLFPVTLPGAGVRGYAMRRVEGHHGLHALYTPKSRRQSFPQARWPFLARAACNVARTFEIVHGSGLVVGDINHSSVLVGRRATVALIDCDSFQVEVEGRTFTCDVGVDAYTPPELQNTRLTGLVRDVGHDGFGLAVLVFQLLFLGRHPFAGVFAGRGEMTISRAIEECRFAYADGHDMSPPPGSLPYGCVGEGLTDLFDRAFSREASAGIVPRPAASEWSAALSAFEAELVPCRADSDHHMLPGGGCPFCAVERVTGAPTFASVDTLPVVEIPDEAPYMRRLGALPAKLGDDFLARAQKRVRALDMEPPVPTGAVLRGKAVRAYDKANGPARWLALLAALGWGVPQIPLVPDILLWVALGLAFFAAPRMAGRFARWLAEPEETLVRARWERLVASMRGYPATGRYPKALAEARKVGNGIAELEDERKSMLGGLSSNIQEWLGSHAVADSGIDGLGSVRIEALANRGVRSARDVNRRSVVGVEGIGPVMGGRLVAWRSEVEGRYRNLLASPATRSRITASQIRIAKRKEMLVAAFETALAEAEAECARARASDGGFMELLLPEVAAYLGARKARDHVLCGHKPAKVPKVPKR